ncbi:hypothetical protein Slin15195_G118140 [Septoria linicola]|uniref:Uncharacterized protein n=1 Tax=Septoria linicola TaxID=215465 RepID=A0A9Q9B598_9PEZI|nr:hypothetical protein Slin14017_G095140 [Septoria linicola]USW58495.1 hypothetical protein Slin15195_G118140 [Septoria linicola]
MATAEVASSPAERPPKRRPFANFVKRLTNFKSNDQKKDESGKKAHGGGGGVLRHRKNNTLPGKNNPYPQSGHLHEANQASQPSFGTSAREQYESASFSSLPDSSGPNREGHNSHSNKSGAPTLATNAETVHSEAGNSRAVTTSTGAGALSTVGANSTFSSPNHSDHSLTTTLTTIQSTSNAAAAASHAPSQYSHYNSQSQPNGSDFSHQYPVSPAPSAAVTASAIPRHLHTDSTSASIANTPATYNSATANNMLSDNASILTLASSSKRRRRSMDTDASVRALAPGSTFGGSRESLPLSVLSGGQETSRQSIGGIPGTASAERASVYSSSGLAREMPGTHTSALQSERNSYYNRPGDAKSLRSITNIKDDARSVSGMDARSQYDAKSLHDVASLRSVDARSGLQTERGDGGHHARNGSIPGSIGGPTYTPSLLRQTSAAGTLDLSRRSSNWDEGAEHNKENNEVEAKKQQD